MSIAYAMISTKNESLGVRNQNVNPWQHLWRINDLMGISFPDQVVISLKAICFYLAAVYYGFLNMG